MNKETHTNPWGDAYTLTYDSQGREVLFEQGRFWQKTKYTKTKTKTTDSLGRTEIFEFHPKLEAVADSFVEQFKKTA